MHKYKYVRLEICDELDSKEFLTCEMEQEDMERLRQYFVSYIYYTEMKRTTFIKPTFGHK